MLRTPTPAGPVPYQAALQADSDVWWIGSDQVPWTTGTDLVAAVERALGMIVAPLTSVWPWRTYRGEWLASDAEPVRPPTWLRDPTLISRMPGVDLDAQLFLPLGWKQPGPTFWAQVLRHAVMFGAGWVAFTENTSVEPVAGTFIALAPSTVDVDDDGLVTIDLGDGTTVTTDRAGRFDSQGRTWRVVALREPLGDGTGVIGRHAATLGLAVNVAGYTSATFSSGVPNGYLKVQTFDFDKTQADALKASWMAAHGDKRSIAVLNATTEFNPITWSPVDAAVADVDHLATRKIAHAFNLSAWALDAGAGGNDYANITDRRQDRVDETLMPWKRAVEETLSALLPYGTWLELETRGYLQTDPERRMAYYKAGADLGMWGVAYPQDLERVPVGYRSAPVDGESEVPDESVG